MRTRFLILVTLALLLAGSVPRAHARAHASALSDLQAAFHARWQTSRGEPFQRILAANHPLIGSLNERPASEFIGVDPHGHPQFYHTDNLVAARTVNTDQLWPGMGYGYSLTGSSSSPGELAVWDNGSARLAHVEFTGRVVPGDGDHPAADHATHITGTIAAAGAEHDARGMSYQARLTSYRWDDDDAEMAAAAADRLHVSNHSYGLIRGWEYFADYGWGWFGNPDVSEQEDYLFGFYSEQTAGWDELAQSAPRYLIVKSAGNDRVEGPPPGAEHWFFPVWDGEEPVLDPQRSTRVRDLDGAPAGYETIGTKACAKNILTVGAILAMPGGYDGPESVEMTDYSTWGPTDDGRIKPDLVADGEWLYSPVAHDPGGNESDTSYALKHGTSTATANVSGSMNLLAEYHAAARGEYPLSSTLRALVAHTAREAGDAPGPDYRFGWGLLDTRAAADVIREAAIVDSALVETELAEGELFAVRVRAAGAGPLCATAAWIDPPGGVSDPVLDDPAPKLVNDLDLRLVRDATGTTYYPWTLDPAEPDQPPDPSGVPHDNDRDNVEQVVINTPAPGLYSVRVGHEGTLQGGGQSFTLAISPPLHVTLESDGEPVVIPAEGGVLAISGAVANSFDIARAVDVWTTAVLPGGEEIGPLFSAGELDLPALGARTGTFAQPVPGFAPPGDYSLIVHAGTLGHASAASDTLAFAKSARSRGGEPVAGWGREN
ncbi:MAG: hypothetical protein MAG453_00102 [Calditrichaeota bacterium]|nr:hypothetical protein [Calditrichota bacterium]